MSDRVAASTSAARSSRTTWRPIASEEVLALCDLGEVVHQARTAAELSQGELAKAVTLSKRHLQRIEAGQRRTRLSTLKRLAEFLACFLVIGEDDLLEVLLQAAGRSLAQESEYADNVELRRAQRARRQWRAELRDGRLRRRSGRQSLADERVQQTRIILSTMRRNAGA